MNNKIAHYLFVKEIQSATMQRIELVGIVLGLLGLLIAILSIRDQLKQSEIQNRLNKTEVVLRSFDIVRVAKETASKGNIGQVEAIESLNENGISLSNMDFSGMYLRNLTLNGADLRSTNFENSDVYGSNFFDSNLQDANFSNVSLVNVILPKNRTVRMSLFGAEFDSTSPTLSQQRSRIQASEFGGFDFFSVNLDESYISFLPSVYAGSDISYSTMRNVDYQRIIAPFSQFLAIDMTDSNFDGAILSGSSFNVGSCGTEGNYDPDCDPSLNLSGVSFKNTELTGVNFDNDVLFGQDLDIFADACFDETGIGFDIIFIDCETTSLKIPIVSVLVTGAPNIPKNFTQPKTCNAENNKIYNYADRARKYYVPTYNDERELLIQDFIEEIDNSNFKALRTTELTKEYCASGNCICPHTKGNR